MLMAVALHELLGRVLPLLDWRFVGRLRIAPLGPVKFVVGPTDLEAEVSGDAPLMGRGPDVHRRA